MSKNGDAMEVIDLPSKKLSVKDKPSVKEKHKKKRKKKVLYEDLLRESILQNAKKSIDQGDLELERLVFGGEADILEQLTSEVGKKKSKRKKVETDANFVIDTKGEVESLCEGEKDEEEITSHVNKDEVKKRSAWVDEADDKILVSEKAKTLRNCHRSVTERGSQKYKEYALEKFLQIHGTPKWAKLDRDVSSEDSGEEEEDEKLLQKTGNFLVKSDSLPRGNIDIRKCQNLTDADAQSTVVKSVEFHPSSRVALVAGLNGTATLFQVDGKLNPKIQSVHFERFPIYTSHFTADGNEIIVGAREFGHFFAYDMIRGKINKIPWERGMEQMNVRRFQVSPDGKIIIIHGRYGNIHLISAKTKEWISSLKMNGEVVAVAFNRDGSRMYSHGDTGQVYVWDMTRRHCIHKFNDEGCIIGSSLTVSPNEQFLATGSDTGVVNVYDNSSLLLSPDPKPLKVIMNLTTEVTNLKFNCTSELLAIASSHKKEAVKLVHFPSMTVFSNFPTLSKKLYYVNSLDLSLNSGYLMLGNNIGKVYLYRLRQYANY